MSTGLAVEGYRDLLIQELRRRQQRNPSYSLRAFASHLAISPAHLSLLISGKKRVTAKQALKIAEKLDLPPSLRSRLVDSLLPEALRSAPGLEDSFRLLDEDEFAFIADWYHFAILSLGKLRQNSSDAAWIARRLGITPIEALDGFRRLSRLGLVERKGAGFRQTGLPLRTSNQVPSRAIRQYHKQNLDLAKEKIDAVPLEERDFSSITMASNSTQLKKAGKLIEEFKQRLSRFLEEGEPEEVYTLAVQLFPVTTQEKRK